MIVSDTGLIGGGRVPRPGEVSLAHHGVLFLDELPEFHRRVVEALRQPLEEARVTIGRAAATLSFPSRFMLVASMNPCPCGYLGHARHDCICQAHVIERYRARLSGPLLDRIDLHVQVARRRLRRPADGATRRAFRRGARARHRGAPQTARALR